MAVSCGKNRHLIILAIVIGPAGAAIRHIRSEGDDQIAAVEDHEWMRLVGVVHQRDVTTAYRRAILSARGEEPARG